MTTSVTPVETPAPTTARTRAGFTPTDLGLCKPADAPVGNAPLTDGAPSSAADLPNAFPYLNSPYSNSPRTLGTATVPHP